MKYIRTKDGRLFKGSNYGFGVGMPYKNYDVKVADTVPELCDMFVMKTYLTYYTNSHLKDLLLEYDKFHFKDGIVIYGAIFTDEGIIYKAKMKGVLPHGEIEWELL